MAINPILQDVGILPTVPGWVTDPTPPVEPSPPLIRPEIRPPVVYDVPIPGYVHPSEVSVISPTTGEIVTKETPGYKRITTRTIDPIHGDVLKVEEPGRGTTDLFPVKAGEPVIFDPQSRYTYIYEDGEETLVERTHMEHVIQKEFWGLPGQGMQGTPALFEIGTRITEGAGDIFGGIGDFFNKYGAIIIIGIAAIFLMRK